jgi:hypothetical protein
MQFMDVDQAKANHLKNIEARTGKTMDELAKMVAESGLSKHGEVVAMLKQSLGIGHGDANAVALYAKGAGAAAQDETDPVAAMYSGPKAALRPIHDAVMAEIGKLGEFEVAPKKGYVSLRRKKQFAMVGPATNTRVEVGLNMKGVDGTERLEALPAGGMCQYKVKVTDPAQVDSELIGWIRQAFDSAG